jgi:predicted PurR-regulated permease PerM
MSPRLPRRTRAEPVSPPEQGAHELGEDQDGLSEPLTSQTTEFSPGTAEHDHDAADAGGEPSGTVDRGDLESAEPATSRPAAHAVPPVVVPRWIQLVVLPLALLGLWALARAVGSVVLIVLVAAVTALVLNPLVRNLERLRVPRGLAILAVYVGGLAALAGIGLLLSEPVSTQISKFQADVPHLVKQANRDLVQLQNWLSARGINVHIQKQGQTALQTLQKDVLKRSSDILSFSRDLLQQAVTLGFDLILTLVLSIYMLAYGKQIGNLVRRIMPDGDGTPEDDYPLLVQRAVFGYVRGQVLFSLIMGASAALALWILGVIGIFPEGQRLGVFFGAFYGLMEFIPYIGPIIGPIPAILVALFNSPISAVWVTAVFIGLQQLEGHFVAPQVFRLSLRINPIVIILSLLVGFELYGIIGSLLALPIAAIIRQTVLYLRRHLVLEPWTTNPVGAPPLVLGSEREQDSAPQPSPCPECGAASESGDAFCRSCGASLQPTVRTPG